jgi:hypothetical protein
MPAWTRTSVRKKQVTFSGASTSTTDSDPAGWNEAAAADTQTGFLYVEKIDAGISLFVFRHHGARADLMKAIDGSTPLLTITTTGVHQIDWPATLGAASRTELKASSTGAGEVIFELDEVFRTDGG